MKYLIANWKANPTSPEEAKSLFLNTLKAAENSNSTQVIICPPAIFLSDLSALGRQHGVVKLGAQSVFWSEHGPFTGQITTDMLVELGVEYVLVGHSEQRAAGETDEIVNKKMLALAKTKLKPVLLIGESDPGLSRNQTLRLQLSKALEGFSVESAKSVIYVYEPVWAISTNPGARADTPQNAIAAAAEIRAIVRDLFEMGRDKPLAVLYGGSVNDKNASDFLSEPELDGAIVGGASLNSETFGRIIEAVSKIS